MAFSVTLPIAAIIGLVDDPAEAAFNRRFQKPLVSLTAENLMKSSGFASTQPTFCVSTELVEALRLLPPMNKRAIIK